MTAVPLTDQQLRDRIAAAFERIDAHQWGYDHGFCSVYGIDQETDSFIDAALAVMQPELDRLRAELEQARQQTEALHALTDRDQDGICCSRLVGDLRRILDAQPSV